MALGRWLFPRTRWADSSTDIRWEDTDHARVEATLVKHGRRTYKLITEEGSEITDKGVHNGRGVLWPVVFKFNPEGMMISCNRRFKAWWLLRGSRILVP